MINACAPQINTSYVIINVSILEQIYDTVESVAINVQRELNANMVFVFVLPTKPCVEALVSMFCPITQTADIAT